MVTAVSNGAVVYRRDAVHHHHHQQLLSPYTASTHLSHCSISSEFSRLFQFKLIENSLQRNDAVVETPRRLYRKILDARRTTGDKSQDDMLIGDGRSLRRNMSVTMRALVSPRVTLAPGPGRCHALESPKLAAGCPLLNKAYYSDKASDEGDEEKQLPEELVSLRDKYSSKYTMFSYRELAKITNGFSPGILYLHFILKISHRSRPIIFLMKSAKTRRIARAFARLVLKI